MFGLYYQRESAESAWTYTAATERDRVVRDIKPAFLTVLDVAGIPADGDWSKARYLGPLYFDFDADGDIELACMKFREFLGKLSETY